MRTYESFDTDLASPGDQFVILTSMDLQGTFDAVGFPNSQWGWFIDYGTLTPNAITVGLAPVPEPSTYVMAVLGLLGLGLYGLRRRRVT